MAIPEQQTQADRGNSGIASALERLEAVVRKKPEFARDANRSVTTIVEGLRCQSDEGDWHMQSDMPTAIGGEGSGPTPGMLGRAALGSCLAMG